MRLMTLEMEDGPMNLIHLFNSCIRGGALFSLDFLMRMFSSESQRLCRRKQIRSFVLSAECHLTVSLNQLIQV